MRIFEIDPVSAPRQVRRDRWKPSPHVLRYRAFKDQVRALGIQVPESGSWLKFYMPMPRSWSKKKRAAMLGQAHQQKPDIDNLVNSLLDAIYEDDCHIWDVRASKFWGEKGMITIERSE